MHAQDGHIYGKTVKFDVGTCAWFMFFNGAFPTEIELMVINDNSEQGKPAVFVFMYRLDVFPSLCVMIGGCRGHLIIKFLKAKSDT